MALRREDRDLSLLFVFVLCFSLSWRQGSCSVWLLAECTVHVEMSSDRRRERGGEGRDAGERKDEVSGAQRLKSEESAVTRRLGGLRDMF